jgi:hypothetical protein
MSPFGIGIYRRAVLEANHRTRPSPAFARNDWMAARVTFQQTFEPLIRKHNKRDAAQYSSAP